ncbi:hypothetical protein F4778DRAFT_787660 [Xylariomycetidae sp. FL2044]|nr:hypothetical protein F4778DRAFT_787660 [Xylariomycetidae sp. FL2044]
MRTLYFLTSALLGIGSCLGSPVQERQEITYCADADQPTVLTTGDPEDGPGVWITNNDVDPNVKYFVYENLRDTHPWKYLDVPQGNRAFVQLCPTFQGRIVRGTPAFELNGQADDLGTWIEITISGGTAWGDISFLQGADGGARLTATDGSAWARECVTENLLSGAPAEALVRDVDGNLVVDVVEDKPWRAGNRAARTWLESRCLALEVFIHPGNVAVISSANGRFEILFTGGVA